MLRLISARCGDVLSEADLDKFLAGSDPDPDGDRLPMAVGDKIMDVLLAFEDRLDRIGA